MKTFVALLAVCALMPVEGKILRMQDYHKILDGMFVQSCAAAVPDHSGLRQLKKEIEACYEEKKLPVSDELKLSGEPIGLEGNTFSGEYITASSSRDEKSGPQRGRLNIVKTEKLGGAWCSEVNNDLQYWQVDLGAVHEITAIVIQGSNRELNWVRTYTLQVSNDGKHWGCVFGSDGRVKVFNGNVDSDTPVTSVMNPVIPTRYIRIVPKSWTTHICLRVEIYVKKLVPREKEEPEPIPDFETSILEVNPKRPDALVVKSFHGNQVDTGVVPEEWTDQRDAPIKSISFERTKDQPELLQVRPALDTEVLGVNPKETIVVKNGGDNRIDTGALPEVFTDQQQAPIKSISFESESGLPDLLPVLPAGVVGSPLNPIDVKSLVVSGGPVFDHAAPGVPKLFDPPKEVSTFGDVKPVYVLEYKSYPEKFNPNVYIEFAFGYPVHIRGISTRGRRGEDQWVINYKIMYLNPYVNKWVWLQDEDSMDDLRIKANEDDSSYRDHIYSPAIFTRRLRLFVLEYNKKPAIKIKLSLGSVPREEPQILTGPVYDRNLVTWSWEDRSALKGDTQEVFFIGAILLKEFTLEAVEGSASSITTYSLQYLVAAGQWKEIIAGETSKFSLGEKVALGRIKTKGLRVIVDSWTGEGQFNGLFRLKISKEDVSDDGVIRDIIEKSNHYLYLKWEDKAPAAGSAVVFRLKEVRELTRIETKGSNGAWVAKYQLECRSHYEQQGTSKVLAGNTNGEDIVEHDLDPPLACKYVIIRPIENEGALGMGIWLYSDAELVGATAKIKPGTVRGSFDGEWNPPGNSGDPYLEFTFSHHIMPTKITLGASDGSSVRKFKLQRSGVGETFESVAGVEELIDVSPGLTALRVLPVVNGEGDNGFKYAVEFVANEKVEVKVKRVGGTAKEPAKPTSRLSGNYDSTSSAAGQFVLITFEEPATVHQCDIEGTILGSNITKFNLLYKTKQGGEYTKIEEGGVSDFQGGEKGKSVNLGERKVTELKIQILEAEGEGVKFEYALLLSGNVPKYSITTPFGPLSD